MREEGTRRGGGKGNGEGPGRGRRGKEEEKWRTRGGVCINITCFTDIILRMSLSISHKEHRR